MKTLYLIRHAKSSWKDPELKDIDRPLNKRGLRDAPFMAEMLAHKTQGQLDAIITSPAVRAATTAAYFGKAFGLTPITEEKIYDAWETDMLQLIQSIDNKLNQVAVFGHNPTFTSLANRFSKTHIDNFPTCGIVKIEADIDDWKNFSFLVGEVTAFYYPKQFQ